MVATSAGRTNYHVYRAHQFVHFFHQQITMAIGVDIFYGRHHARNPKGVGPIIFSLPRHFVVYIVTSKIIKGRCSFCADYHVHDIKRIGRSVRKVYRYQITARFSECLQHFPFAAGGVGDAIEIIFGIGNLQPPTIAVRLIIKTGMNRTRICAIGSMDGRKHYRGIRCAATNRTYFIQTPTQGHPSASADTSECRTQSA